MHTLSNPRMARELSAWTELSDDARAELEAAGTPPPRWMRRMRSSRRKRADDHGKQYFQMPQWMANDPNTPNEVVRVYSYFACYNGGWCRKGVLAIAVELHMDPKRLQACLKILKERKLIQYGKHKLYQPTPRRATPYGDYWCRVYRDAVVSLTARGLRVMIMVDHARMCGVPDPTVAQLTAVCGFWSGKPCQPGTIVKELRRLRADGWMDHMNDPVARPEPPVVPIEQEDAVTHDPYQPESIPVDVIRDIVQGPLTPQNDPDRFEEFWRAYPRKVGKGNARKAWAKALTITTAQVMIDAARQFRMWQQHTEARWIPHAATWLNGERWDDEPDQAPVPRSTTDERVDMAMEATRRVIEKYGNIDMGEVHRRRMLGESE